MSLMAPEVAAKQHTKSNSKPSEIGIQSYNTKDGLIMLGVFAPHQYAVLHDILSDLGFEVEGLKSVASWQDVWSLGERTKTKISHILTTKTAHEWVDILHDSGLAAETIKPLDESIRSQQLKARNYFVTSPLDNQTKLPLAPYKMSEGGPTLTLPPPTVGEHSIDILLEHGYSNDMIDVLIREGVVN